MFTPLFGRFLSDFVEGGPEREGLSEIPAARLLTVEEGDAILCPASPASLKTMLEAVAYDMSVTRLLKEVEKSDSVKRSDAFAEEAAEFFIPFAEMQATELMLQMKLDCYAAGVDPTDYVSLGINTEHQVVGFRDAAEAARRFEAARPA